MSNTLPLSNTFGIAQPPKWWLDALSVFDDQLVIFPSQKDPVYRLGRKSRLSAGIEPSDVPGIENHPDTVIMRRNGLVPVTTVIPGAIWDLRVFKALAERDTQRLGGFEGTMRALEAQDQAAEAEIARVQEDELAARGVDAYASLQYRDGARVSLAHTGPTVNRRQGTPQVFDRKVAPTAVPVMPAFVS